MPPQEIPDGLVSISTKSCSTCDQDIYNEWKQSTHVVAFQDGQFQAEMKKGATLTCITPYLNHTYGSFQTEDIYRFGKHYGLISF